MGEEITILLLFAMLTGIYLLGCLAAVLFITKNIVKWLKH